MSVVPAFAAAVLPFAAVLVLAGVVPLLASPNPATAQVVRGTLVGEADGKPLGGGNVALMSVAGVIVDSTHTGGDGRFTLRARQPGTYQLYFTHADYASIPSDTFRLAVGDTVERRFVVPLIAGAAMARIGQVIDLEKRLQGNITELCGERPRSWEAGLLVGTVSDAATKKPLAGAVVRVEASAPPGGQPFRRSTVTSANGVYVICNVPAGGAVMRVELPGYRPDVGPVQARAGDVGWYDIALRREVNNGS
jgi:Carboxypeptidase regulatory-like domain